jgi:gamma-glutamylcyclotransferase (GGCT)/AIG2-like uncharacterized protein YtfP
MERRCPGAEFIGLAWLDDHKLVMRGVADIVPSVCDEVCGALWEITPEHLLALDRFEAYPRLYTRRQLEVKNSEGDLLLATTYFMPREDSAYSPPRPGYEDCLHHGYLDCGIPRAQLERSILNSTGQAEG